MSATSGPRVGAIIVAAGSGTRFGRDDKVLLPVGGRPVIVWSLELFVALEVVQRIVIVAGEHSYARISEVAATAGVDKVTVCLGGSTRRESVQLGFEQMPDSLDYVAVHDAARPLAGRVLVEQTIAAALEHGAAVPGLPVSDTIYRMESEILAREIQPRERVRTVQTPQVSRREWLAKALALPGEFSDEGSALMAAGYPVAVVEGSQENFKITWPDDVERADAILRKRSG